MLTLTQRHALIDLVDEVNALCKYWFEQEPEEIARLLGLCWYDALGSVALKVVVLGHVLKIDPRVVPSRVFPC